jgi:nucleotide-binding universal stress UspA family protein
MSLKKISVLVDETQGSEARIATALIMAEKFDSHLLGIFAFVPENLQESHLLDFPAASKIEINNNLIQHHEKVASRVERFFREKAEKAGRAEKSSFIKIMEEPDRIAEFISRYSDLVIAGQSLQWQKNAVCPSAVIMASGCPIFVVPQNFRKTSGEYGF